MEIPLLLYINCFKLIESSFWVVRVLRGEEIFERIGYQLWRLTRLSVVLYRAKTDHNVLLLVDEEQFIVLMVVKG